MGMGRVVYYLVICEFFGKSMSWIVIIYKDLVIFLLFCYY